MKGAEVQFVDEIAGSLVCGVLRRGDGLSLMAESRAGKTFVITVSGDGESVEHVFKELYADPTEAVRRYYKEMRSCAKEYYELLEMEKADSSKLRTASEKLKLALAIFSDDPAYHAMRLFKHPDWTQRVESMLLAIRPEMTDVDSGWGCLKGGNYASISYMRQEREKNYVMIEPGNGVPISLEVLDISGDVRSIEQLVVDVYGFGVPAVSPCWQEKFRLAQKYLELVGGIGDLEEESALNTLLEKLDTMILSFSGGLMADRGFFSTLKIECEFALIRRRNRMIRKQNDET